MNKFTALFIVFTHISLLSLSAAQDIVNRELINPFKEKDRIGGLRLDNLHVYSREGGTRNAPSDVPVSFAVLDHKNNISGSVAPHNFSYRISRREDVYRVPGRTSFAGKNYIADLDLPRVRKSGWYRLEVELRTHGQVNSSIARDKAIYISETVVNIVFLIDNSQSMSQNDPGDRRIDAICDVINSPEYSGSLGRVAVIGFSDGARIIWPFTWIRNKKIFTSMLKKNVRKGGTNIPLVFRTAADMLKKESFTEKTIVIFLTDGVSGLPYRDEHRLLKDLDIPVYTVGLSTDSAAGYDEKLLKRIARDTGGIFSKVDDFGIAGLFNGIVSRTISRTDDISIYDLARDYHEDEVIPCRVYVPLNSRKMDIRIELNGREPEILVRRSQSSLREVLLFPPPPGNHVIRITAAVPEGRNKTAVFHTRVKGEQKLLRLEGDFNFKKLEKDRTSTIFFTCCNLSDRKALAEMIFLPLRNDDDRRMDSFFSIYNNPFSLNSKEKVTKNLSLTVHKSPAGLYNGYFLVRAGSRLFLNNVSAELMPYRTDPSGDFLVSGKSPLLKKLLSGIKAVFIPLLICWIAVIILFIIILRRKKNL